MKFIKAHCGANDFIILDSRKDSVPKDLKKTAQLLPARRTGIGADGIIVIEPSKEADFRLRYFNPDGSEYAVCGDGSLCAVLYECRGVSPYAQQGKKEISFSTLAGVLRGNLTNNKVKVKIPSPRDVKLSLQLKVEAKNSPHQKNRTEIECNFVDIWVPHCIIFVEDIDSIDIVKDASPVRFHPYFGSKGTNVNFVQVINEHKIAVRTYERGVEGETLSCGSGSCASCVVGWLKKKLRSPIEVKTRIGKLVVYIDGQQLMDIWLEGKPEIVYAGEI